MVAVSFTSAQAWAVPVALSGHLLLVPDSKGTGWRSQALVMQGAFALPGPTHSKILIWGFDVNALWMKMSPGVQTLVAEQPVPLGPPSETFPTVCEPSKWQ